MATYLELCQKVVSESGTADGTLPSTVAGQVGRLAKIVRWVKDAYTLIQNAHREWLWLQDTFEGPTIVGQRNYDGNDMGVTERFRRFISTQDRLEDRFTIYDPSIGVSDEGPLSFRPYNTFYASFMRGTQTQAKPLYFTLSPDGKMLLHPIPDKVYTVRGLYRKSSQTLDADDDIPEMPEEYHDLIAEVALLYLATHDETPQIGGWQLRKIERMNQLRRDQLPPVEVNAYFA
jgi:hypothetical protein